MKKNWWAVFFLRKTARVVFLICETVWQSYIYTNKNMSSQYW